MIPEDKSLRYEDAIKDRNWDECPLHRILISNDTLAVAYFEALTHYPELCGQSISLQYGSIRTSMAAQPKIWSVFRKRDHRKYRIIVNKKQHKPQARLIYGASFDARVGVMGHELAHILDYSEKSGWQLIWTGVRYLGKKHRRVIEYQTDSLTVARGLGWQLYAYAYYVIHEAEIDEEYRNYKLEYYMKPEEIYEKLN